MRLYLLVLAVLLILAAVILNPIVAHEDAAHDKIRVVVSLPIFKSIVEEVGGVHVDVRAVMPEGGEPHLFQVTPQVVEEVVEADLVVFTGHFEFEAELEVATRGKTVLTLSPEGSYGGYRVKILDLPGSGRNLHGYWLLPENGEAIASAIADALSKIDPEHADYYRGNLESFMLRLKEIEKEYSEASKAAGFEGGEAVVAFPAEQYVAHTLGVEVVGVLSLGHGLTPSGSTLVELEEKLKGSERPIIIASDMAWTLNLGPFVEELADKTGATIVRVRVIGGELGYLELLSFNLGSVTASFMRSAGAAGSSSAQTPLLILVGVLATVTLLEGALLIRIWR